MASISELDIIRRNPIKGGLDAFRDLFKLRRAELGVTVSLDIVQLVFSRSISEVVKELVLDLIQALLIEPAARSLHSRIAKRSLSGDLAMIYSLVDSNELDFSLAVPLVGQVVCNNPNADTWFDSIIWLAVFELVAQTNSLTPPNPFENVVLDTPLRSRPPSRWVVEHIHEEIGPQITESESTPCTEAREPRLHRSTLCSRCSAIDLNAAFSLQIRHSKGQLICHLGLIPESQKVSPCPLCRLFADMSPNTTGIQLEQGQPVNALRAFSSLAVYGDARRDVRPTKNRIIRDVQDSVFLGVVHPQSDLKNSWYQRGYIAPDRNSASMAEDVTFRVCEVKHNAIDFNRIGNWINFCRSHHLKLCNSSNEETAQSLKLIDCSTRRVIPASREWKYAALSYVWGSSSLPDPQPALEFLPHGIPATIEDAMTVTVRLGLQYLWIDRYCIDQQNQHEKHIQVSQMDIVYMNAEVTIIAAAGDNPRHGLPGMGTSHRIPQPSAQAHGILLKSTLPDGKFAIEESLWSKRGWTYQEAILSRRRLVFTRHQIYFQCNGMHCCEAILKPLDLLHVKNKQRMKAWNGDGPFSAGGLGKYHWELLDRIAEFTGRRLTYESDILNAMSGILNAYRNLQRPVFHYYGVPSLPPCMNTQQVGVAFGKLIRMVTLPNSPENGLATGLCWFLERPSLRRPGFPSWSWAGWLGQVSKPTHDRFRYYYGFPEGHLNLKIWIELKDTTLCRWEDAVTSLDELRDYSLFLHIETWTVEIRFQYFPHGIDGIWEEQKRPTIALNRETGFYARFEIGASFTAYSYFVLTKEVEIGSVFYNRLNTTPWTGIVLGDPCLKVKDVRARGPFILVVDILGDFAERIGHINLLDFECNWPDNSLKHLLPAVRKRIRLG